MLAYHKKTISRKRTENADLVEKVRKERKIREARDEKDEVVFEEGGQESLKSKTASEFQKELEEALGRKLTDSISLISPIGSKNHFSVEKPMVGKSCVNLGGSTAPEEEKHD